MTEIENKLLSYLTNIHGAKFVSRFKYIFNRSLGSIDLLNRSVLEIGAGPGYMSAMCAARSASRVVALEPEGDGSTRGVNQQFAQLRETLIGSGRLASHTLDYNSISLEQFQASRPTEKFDVILMYAVINHIDEDAVTKLHLPDADKARENFVAIFRQLRNMLTDQGRVIISDVGRTNFWNSIGLGFPACPTIEWHKHQNPKVWIRLMTEAGFKNLSVEWLPLYRLRHLKALVGLRWVAQCLNSEFLINGINNLDSCE